MGSPGRKQAWALVLFEPIRVPFVVSDAESELAEQMVPREKKAAMPKA